MCYLFMTYSIYVLLMEHGRMCITYKPVNQTAIHYQENIIFKS